MKALYKVLLALSLVTAAICITSGIVSAEDKHYYELNLYEKETYADFSNSDFDAYYWVFDYRGRYEWNDEEEAEYDYFQDSDTAIAVTRCAGDCSRNENILVEIRNGVTASDNRTFDFTDEEKTEIAEGSYANLAGYDGIIFRVSNEQEECSSVCVTRVDLIGVSDGAREKSRPKYSGLNISFDLYFSNQDQVIEYEIELTNATGDDLQFSANIDDDYIDYTVEVDNSDFPAKSQKTIRLKISLKTDIPDDVLDNDNILSSGFAIDIQAEDKTKPETIDDHVDDNILPNTDNRPRPVTTNTTKATSIKNPNTLDQPVPVILAAASGAILLIILAKNRQGRKKNCGDCGDSWSCNNAAPYRRYVRKRKV